MAIKEAGNTGTRTVSSVLGKEAVKLPATQAVQKAATEAGKKLGEKGVIEN